MIQLTGDSRARLREIIRAHPGYNPLPDAPHLSSLPKADLLALAARLQIDVAAIVAGNAPPLAPRPARAATPPQEQEQESESDMTPEPETAPDVTAEATALRRDLASAMVEGNFDHVTQRLADLLADAHKPPVTIYVASDDPGAAAAPRAPAPVPAATGSATWGALFGLTGPMASRKALTYAPHPTTPLIEPRYRWPNNVTQAALCAMGRGRNVWLFGPAGTGKSSFAEQLAARTGRPFFMLACDDTTEAPELVGMTVPHAGSVRWQDGVLTAALRVPHAIILIDEPTVARPGAIMVLQSVLQARMLAIKETGEVVRAAEGIKFIVADNTNGTGGGSAEGYEGTRRMNRATLDRFANFLKVDYMTPDDEAGALIAHTSCTPQLAKILVECAGLTRKAKVTHALGLRRLIAWAEALTDGIEPRAAFEFTILNSCARDDREPTEQCCALGLDKRSVTLAIAGTVAPTLDLTSPRQSRAAADFAE